VKGSDHRPISATYVLRVNASIVGPSSIGDLIPIKLSLSEVGSSSSTSSSSSSSSSGGGGGGGGKRKEEEEEEEEEEEAEEDGNGSP